MTQDAGDAWLLSLALVVTILFVFWLGWTDDERQCRTYGHAGVFAFGWGATVRLLWHEESARFLGSVFLVIAFVLLFLFEDCVLECLCVRMRANEAAEEAQESPV